MSLENLCFQFPNSISEILRDLLFIFNSFSTKFYITLNGHYRLWKYFICPLSEKKLFFYLFFEILAFQVLYTVNLRIFCKSLLGNLLFLGFAFFFYFSVKYQITLKMIDLIDFLTLCFSQIFHSCSKTIGKRFFYSERKKIAWKTFKNLYIC